MPQYIYTIFCWNDTEITGVQKQFVLLGFSLENAKQSFIEKYQTYLQSNILFQYKNYRYVYKYEYEPTGIYDSRNHMIYRPLYNYVYNDILSLIRERDPCKIVDNDLIIV